MKDYLYGHDVLKVNKRLFVALGQVRAIVYEQTCAEVKSNRERKRDAYRNDRWWMYFSLRKLVQRDFPFLGVDAVGDAYRDLAEYNLLLRGNFNRLRKDRTYWYAPNIDIAYRFIASLEANERVNHIPIDEYIFVQKDLLCAFGLPAGIVLRTLAFFLRENEIMLNSMQSNQDVDCAGQTCIGDNLSTSVAQSSVDDVFLREGRIWTKNSVRAWVAKYFQIFDEKTLQRAFDFLEALGILESRQFELYDGDAAKSYTINIKVFDAFMEAWIAFGSPRSLGREKVTTAEGQKKRKYDHFVDDWKNQFTKEIAEQQTVSSGGVFTLEPTWTTNQDDHLDNEPRPLQKDTPIQKNIFYCRVERDGRKIFLGEEVKQKKQPTDETPQNGSLSYTSTEVAAQTTDLLFLHTSNTESYPPAPLVKSSVNAQSAARAILQTRQDDWREWRLAVLRLFGLEDYVDATNEEFPEIGRYRKAASNMRKMAKSMNDQFNPKRRFTYKNVELLYDELVHKWPTHLNINITPETLVKYFPAHMMERHKAGQKEDIEATERDARLWKMLEDKKNGSKEPSMY